MRGIVLGFQLLCDHRELDVGAHRRCHAEVRFLDPMAGDPPREKARAGGRTKLEGVVISEDDSLFGQRVDKRCFHFIIVTVEPEPVPTWIPPPETVVSGPREEQATEATGSKMPRGRYPPRSSTMAKIR